MPADRAGREHLSGPARTHRRARVRLALLVREPGPLPRLHRAARAVAGLAGVRAARPADPPDRPTGTAALGAYRAVAAAMIASPVWAPTGARHACRSSVDPSVEP